MKLLGLTLLLAACASTPEAAPAGSRVVAVEGDVVVIATAGLDNLQRRDILFLHRDGLYVGHVTIERVAGDHAVCRFDPGHAGPAAPALAGDRVALSPPASAAVRDAVLFRLR